MINVGPLFIPHDKVVLFMLTYMGRGGKKLLNMCNTYYMDVP